MPGTADLHPIRVAEEVLGERHRIHPEIEHRAAAKIGIEQPVLGIVRRVDPQIGIDLSHFADRPVGDEFRPPRSRLETSPHGFHHENLLVSGGLDDLLGTGHGRGERLLDQHGLAST